MPLPALPSYVRFLRDPVAFAAHHEAAQVRRIKSPGTAAAYFAPLLASEEVEVVWVVALDARSCPIGEYQVSRGTVDGACLHVREVFRGAVLLGATGVIVAHNHPSGDVTPSAEDRAITRDLAAARKILGIPLYRMAP
ncbi:MAG: JAB domain-containing protein [Gemmatimonadales bacterium]|nr:JAB domain-containing protein [Gemmatimonadales bacterium]